MAYLMISDKIPTVNDNHTATQSITRGHHIIGLDSEHLNGGTVPLGINISMPSCFTRLKGVVRVWAGESVWLVHASSALWLPPQMPHKFVATGNVLLKTVLVSEAESETLGKKFAS